MMETLLQSKEVANYLQHFPKTDWTRCIEVTLRLGIRCANKAFPQKLSLQKLVSELEGDQEAVSLREQMDNLRKDLEGMSKDLGGLEGKRKKLHMSVASVRTSGKMEDETNTLHRRVVKMKSQKGKGEKTELFRGLKHERSVPKMRQESLRRGSEAQRPFLTDRTPLNGHRKKLPGSKTSPKRIKIKPKNPPELPQTKSLFTAAFDSFQRRDFSRLMEPKTNKQMMSIVSPTAAILEEERRDQLQSASDRRQRSPQRPVLSIADEFLKNPLIAGLTSY